MVSPLVVSEKLCSCRSTVRVSATRELQMTSFNAKSIRAVDLLRAHEAVVVTRAVKSCRLNEGHSIQKRGTSFRFDRRLAAQANKVEGPAAAVVAQKRLWAAVVEDQQAQPGRFARKRQATNKTFWQSC